MPSLTRAHQRQTASSRPAENGKLSPCAALVGAADLIASGLLSGDLRSWGVRAVARQVAEEVGLPVETVLRTLYALVARDSRFLSMDPTVAVEAQLAALLLFSPAIHAS